MSGRDLHEAYRYCEEVTRKHAKSFYFAAKFLPRAKQLPVYAIYAFCRHVDDEIDAGGYETEQQAAEAVDKWKTRLEAVYSSLESADPAGPLSAINEGNFETDGSLDRVFLAWKDLLPRYPIPIGIPLDLISGVLMDTYKKRYLDYEELYLYCYRVASTVGLMSSEVLGYSEKKALEYAEAMGVAMQLTNILRDVGEDAEMGRIYIPKEDLERFGVSEEQILARRSDANFCRLMEFEIARARSLYAEGELGIGYLERDTRFTVLFASRIYAKILREIEALDYDVFAQRAHTTRISKLISMPRIWVESRKMRTPA